jgi:hypothetical protein
MKNNADNGKNATVGTLAHFLTRPRWLFHFSRLLLGVVFVYASYDKILHPHAFAQAVYSYQLLSDELINITALLLPWLELLLGLCLLFNIWLPGAVVNTTGLLLVFLGALIFNQLRGLDIHCGCFSTEVTEGPAGLGTVLRDIGFFIASLYLLLAIFLPGRRRETTSLSKSDQ